MAESPGGLRLDANPATVTQMDPRVRRFKEHDPGVAGGPDENHAVQLKGELDLNGLWRSGPVEVRIRHVENSVEANLTTQGRTLFKGTLNGYELGGQMRVRFPPEWQEDCPNQVEGWATLQMRASEDENQLSGQFQLMAIDENCNLSPSGWKEVTFVRVPEEEARGAGR
jgi:hypothetical protein